MARTDRVLISEAPADTALEYRGMRQVEKVLSPDQTIIENRPVVATMDECRAGKGDYYDPGLRTWFRGYGKFVKAERDPNVTPISAAAVED